MFLGELILSFFGEMNLLRKDSRKFILAGNKMEMEMIMNFENLRNL